MTDTPDPAREAAPRRILYCEVCEDGSAGGSHQILFDTVRLLDRRRYEPVVVFYESNRFVEPLRDQGVEVHVWAEERAAERAAVASGSFSGKVFGVLGAIRRRRRLLVDERIDLVHLNNSPVMGLDDWLPAAKSLRLPCITNVMGAPYALPDRGHHRLLVRRFDRLVCISEHVHREMRAGGYPESQLERVQVGIDVDAFVARARRDPAAVRRELGVAADTMLVALVGNLQPWKGHDVVVSALEGMDPALRRRLRVLFIGAIRDEDRDHVNVLRDRIGKAQLEDVVAFLGSRNDVPDLLRAADVQLHASTFPEPFGLVLVEGLAVGKPVVAASRGGPCEVISPETGLLFDPADPEALESALARLLADPALRARLGAAGPARARLFDAHRTAEAVQDLYDRLLATTHPAPEPAGR
jgi:glycosyltransferase involved in cell wall biosynthesis